MHADISQPGTRSGQPDARRPWNAPSVTPMPPLRDLTLQTAFAEGSDSGAGFTYG